MRKMMHLHIQVAGDMAKLQEEKYPGDIYQKKEKKGEPGVSF